jgi:hypothetical protein
VKNGGLSPPAPSRKGAPIGRQRETRIYIDLFKRSSEDGTAYSKVGIMGDQAKIREVFVRVFESCTARSGLEPTQVNCRVLLGIRNGEQIRKWARQLQVAAHPDRVNQNARGVISAAYITMAAVSLEVAQEGCLQIAEFEAGKTSYAQDIAKTQKGSEEREELARQRRDQHRQLKLLHTNLDLLPSHRDIDKAHPTCRIQASLVLLTTKWAQSRIGSRADSVEAADMRAAGWLAMSVAERLTMSARALDMEPVPLSVGDIYMRQVKDSARRSAPNSPSTSENRQHAQRAREDRTEADSREQRAHEAGREQHSRNRNAARDRQQQERANAENEQRRRAEQAARDQAARLARQMAEAARRETQQVEEQARNEREAEALKLAESAARRARDDETGRRSRQEAAEAAKRSEEQERERELLRRASQRDSGSGQRPAPIGRPSPAEFPARGSTEWHRRRAEVGVAEMWSGYTMNGDWPPRGASATRYSWVMMPFLLDVFRIPWPSNWAGIRKHLPGE